MLPNERLEEIQQRLDRATPGPWEADAMEGYIVAPSGDVATVTRWSDADADLIAHAPEDLAVLVAEVERLRAVAEAYQNWRGIPAIASRIEDRRTALFAVDAALDAWRAGGGA